MEESVREKNICAMHNAGLAWIDKIYEHNETGEEKIVVHKSFKEDIIFEVEKEDKDLFLDGFYCPVGEGQRRAMKIAAKKAKVISVFGCASGIFLKELVRVMPDDTIIMVYEPSLEIIKALIDTVDITELIKRVIFFVKGVNDQEFKYMAERIIVVENYTLLHVEVLPNYDNLYFAEMKAMIQCIKERVNSITTDWNTMKYFSNVYDVNIVHNMKYMLTEYTMNAVADMIPSEVPCIVVAAGPSLNKNIDELKKAKGKSCILACDTALKPLLNHGIVPDFFFIVDPRKPKMLFEHPKVSEIPMVVPFSVPYEILETHNGKKMLYWEGNEFEREAFIAAKKLDKRTIPFEEGLGVLATGGSVATSAFSFVPLTGSKIVIFVGQDLAYTDNKTHADDTFQKHMEKVNTDGEIEVEGYYGGKVKTIPNLKLYKEWFEKRIEEQPGLVVINATEGGALINGCKNMPLKEAISQYCTVETNIEEKLNKIPKLLTETERESLKQFLAKVPKRNETVMKKAREGIKLYQKLYVLSKKYDDNSDKIKSVLNKVSKINKYLNEDSVANLVMESLPQVEYNLRVGIYREEEDAKLELQTVAKQGKTYLRWLEKGAEVFQPLFEEEFGKYMKGRQE